MLDIMDLGRDVPFADALALQERLHTSRCEGRIPDTLVLLEHRSVYTLGRSANAEHVLLSPEALRAAGIECIETNRGGDVTYHGPGQLVGYPIIHLREAGLRVLDYVTALEEVLIRTVAVFGIRAGRDARNRGVWVGNDKLAALGIRISHQVTMHGFALNVTTHLANFRGIVPCGLPDAGVVSMEKLLGAPPDMAEVKRQTVRAFRQVLGYPASERRPTANN